MKNLPKNIMISICLLASMATTSKINAMQNYVLASGSGFGEINIWEFDPKTNVLKKRQELNKRETTIKSIKSMAFSPNKQFFSTVDIYGNLNIWKKSGGSEYVLKGKKIFMQQPKHLKFNKNNELIVYCHEDWMGKTVEMFEINKEKKLQQIEGLEIVKGINLLGFIKNGKFCAGTQLRRQSNKIIIFEVKNNKIEKLKSFLVNSDHVISITSVAFSSTNNKLITTSYDGTVKVWKINEEIKTEKTGGVATPFKKLDTDSLVAHSVAFSPDDKLLAIGGSGAIQIWNAKTWEKIGEYKIKGNIISLAFQPKEERIKLGKRIKKKGKRLEDVIIITEEE